MRHLLKPRPAFSLIELLSVIAVIAILATILIPVADNMRNRSYQAGCASNLRQIHLGITLYSNDHDGLLPGPVFMGQGPFYYKSPTAATNNLPSLLHNYMPSAKRVPQRGTNRYFQPLFACPAWEDAGGADIPSPTSSAGVSYVINLVPWPFGVVEGGSGNISPFGDANNSGTERGTPRRLRDIINFPLSETWMATDADNRLLSDVMNWSANANYRPTPSHRGFRNVLFYDGHVTRVPLGEFKRYP